MELMKGKKGVIFGVSNTHGIAYAIAKQLHDAGADIAFTYAGEAMEKRVRPIAEGMNAKVIMSCDVTNEDEVKAVFDECEKVYGKLDFVVHAVAFAKKEDLMGRFVETSKDGWDTALGVSAYSLVTICRHAEPLMNEGGSIFALTYLGSILSVPSYNVMGVAKAALESAMRFLAVDLGKKGIRVNCISAGPVKTLASMGISGFSKMLKAAVARAPLGRNVSLEDVGKAGLYLASDLSSGTTGEVIYVDCGCHSAYASAEEMDILGEHIEI
ncbi:enoyl-ACP reductase [bacterium]|nr:enoyl-ACP reductase [bacterium]MBO5447311.1 enoyl-ACP reductase [bacterium]